MTDRHESTRHQTDLRAAPTVESLAERAIAVLASKRATGGQVLSESLVLGLIRGAEADDPSELRTAVLDLNHAGVPPEEIIDFYIPEAARRMGEQWCEDGMSFADVTIGVARLQRVMRNLSIDPRQHSHAGRGTTSILVSVVEGEYHTLGAMVLTEQFRRMGVSVRLLLGDDARDTQRIVATGDFDAIFFSVAVAEGLVPVRNLIRQVRQVLPKPTPIVVGGAIGISGLDVKKLTGADHATTDAKEALRQCGLTISPPGARLRATSE
ncbi:MAG: cobalamin B12-binding domain-containing protein [Pseudomonadota bacterium]